jgi:uncharacterized membrane protein
MDNKWAMRDRLRSKTLWAAIAGLIVVLFGAFDLWEICGITQPELQSIFTAIGAVLTAFGVFNDPTERDRF